MSERYFDWTNFPFSRQEFSERREQLYQELGPTEGTLLIPSRQHLSDGFTFRQLDDFYYFSGLELPDSIMALDSGRGEAILFVPERDPRFENPGRPNDFPGRILTADPLLAELSGIKEIRPFEEFAGYLKQLATAGTTVWVNGGRQGLTRPSASRLFAPPDPLFKFAQVVQLMEPSLVLEDAYPAIAQLRMVKSAAEIELMRQACEIAMAGIRVSAAAIRPGITERTLEGIMEAEFKRLGAQRLPFSSIIKSGPNTLYPWRILASHYDRRNRAVEDGELVVYDVGCELDHYGSDMGRTFPAGGHFNPEQQGILEMQLGVLDAMIGKMKPGVTLAEVQAAGEREISPAAQNYMSVKPFFGHHIGLSMGDPSLIEAPLQPGMVITVEPWYYNHDQQIGTFIEDVVLVTESGCENLTEGLPRTAAGMAGMVR